MHFALVVCESEGKEGNIAGAEINQNENGCTGRECYRQLKKKRKKRKRGDKMYDKSRWQEWKVHDNVIPHQALPDHDWLRRHARATAEETGHS